MQQQAKIYLNIRSRYAACLALGSPSRNTWNTQTVGVLDSLYHYASVPISNEQDCDK
jgi:hypothetical protein